MYLLQYLIQYFEYGRFFNKYWVNEWNERTKDWLFSPSFMAIQAKGSTYSVLESSWLERVLKTLCKTDGHSSNTLGSPETAFRIFHDSLFLQWPMLYFLVANRNNHVATQNFPKWHSVWINLYILLHVFYKKTTKGNKNVFFFLTEDGCVTMNYEVLLFSMVHSVSHTVLR